jgi:hypothetical protein
MPVLLPDHTRRRVGDALVVAAAIVAAVRSIGVML